MEKIIKRKISKTLYLSGVLNTTKRKSDKLVVFVHGLGSTVYDHNFIMGSKLLVANGFDTFRIDLYPAKWENGRILTETDISTHVSDLNYFINHFKNKYKKIYLIGHSLGGPVILLANNNLASAISLWDPSTNLGSGLVGVKKFAKYNKALDLYIYTGRVERLISKKMYREWHSVPTPKDLIKNVKSPIQIIVAGKGVLAKAAKEYYKYASKPKNLVFVKNAGHRFTEEGISELLLENTLRWLMKY